MSNSPQNIACHCDDYSRAALLRKGLATAGRGLPDIEPGMPTPAGTGLSRRSMLLGSAGLALTIFGGRALSPAALNFGVEQAAASESGSPILVSVWLSGGLDSLTVLSPVDDGVYRSKRPTLAIPHSGNPVDIFTEDTRLQWHPSASPLRDLHREGKVTVMPGIGWDGSNGSHFFSRHFWEVGGLDPAGRVGWLGKYLDREGSSDNPLQGLSMDLALSPTLATATAPVAAIDSPESLALGFNYVGGAMLPAAKDAYRKLGLAASNGDAELTSARRAALSLSQLSEQVAPMYGQAAPWQNAVAYPTDNPFPRRLATVAEMIGRGMPLRCVSIQGNGGYDTHSGQAGALPGNIALLADSLHAFQRDLERRGVADRVIIHVWSEFGRRVEENGSGTDHGAGGISLLIGNRVRGRMIGEFPGLTNLDELGNLRSTSDYRSLCCSLLEQWLGTDARGIVAGAEAFPRYSLLR